MGNGRLYAALAWLKDLTTGRVLGKAICIQYAPRSEAAPYESLIAADAALLRKQIAEVRQGCTTELRGALFEGKLAGLRNEM